MTQEKSVGEILVHVGLEGVNLIIPNLRGKVKYCIFCRLCISLLRKHDTYTKVHLSFCNLLVKRAKRTELKKKKSIRACKKWSIFYC